MMENKQRNAKNNPIHSLSSLFYTRNQPNSRVMACHDSTNPTPFTSYIFTSHISHLTFHQSPITNHQSPFTKPAFNFSQKKKRCPHLEIETPPVQFNLKKDLISFFRIGRYFYAPFHINKSNYCAKFHFHFSGWKSRT